MSKAYCFPLLLSLVDGRIWHLRTVNMYFAFSLLNHKHRNKVLLPFYLICNFVLVLNTSASAFIWIWKQTPAHFSTLAPPFWKENSRQYEGRVREQHVDKMKESTDLTLPRSYYGLMSPTAILYRWTSQLWSMNNLNPNHQNPNSSNQISSSSFWRGCNTSSPDK